MNQLTLEQLVTGIKKARAAGEVSATQNNRVRIEAQGVSIADCYKALDDGEPFPARESNRVKFVDDSTITFIIFGNRVKGDEKVDHAYIVSAFKRTL
jgi:flagellar basal body rod protein FlgF